MVTVPGNTPPPSATQYRALLPGLMCFCVMFIFLRTSQLVTDPVLTTSLMMAAYALPVMLIELIVFKSFKNPSTELEWHNTQGLNLKRIMVKLVGLTTTLLIIAFIFNLFPEYRQGFYQPFYNFLETWAPLFTVGVPVYFTLIDRQMRDPYDGYWHVGALILGQKDVHIGLIKQHALGWLVKAFFLPLMYVYFSQNLTSLLIADITIKDFSTFYTLAYNFLILLDVGCIVVGYFLTLRILDNHIRTAEPTLQGWVVAVACYQPFWGVIGGLYLSYEDGTNWSNLPLFDAYPILGIIVGSLSLLLMGIYTWASLMFGLRFSNLTHRGIITNGPYRVSRHPAYVCKNISWWLEALPMISVTGRAEAIRNVVRLILVNLLYYMRAKTEERHLAWDLTYCKYAQWIDKKGWLKILNKYFTWVMFKNRR